MTGCTLCSRPPACRRRGCIAFGTASHRVLVGKGVSPRVVMEALGHSQISLTMDTYAHVMPAALQDAARVLEDAFGAPDPAAPKEVLG